MRRFTMLLLILVTILASVPPVDAQLYGWPYSTQAPGMNIRVRLTIAQINAGYTLFNGIPGWKFRMIDAFVIPYGGGTCSATTTVNIASTQTSAVQLVAFAQASLTQSAVLHAGQSGAAVLADGASFVANDAGAAVTIANVGTAIATCTGIDFDITYALEK